MIRVAHVLTVPWSVTEAISRSCREIATELVDCESSLLVDRDTGADGGMFAETRIIHGWTPLMPWRRSFARALRELRPDVVHMHGGDVAPTLAYAPALAHLPLVVTCYRSARNPAGAHGRGHTAGEHHTNSTPLRTAFAHAGGIALGRAALRSSRVGVVCTPDVRVGRDYASAGPVVRVSGGARLGHRRAGWSATPTVVFAGRAQVGRGVDDLIDAFTVVRDRVPTARLLLLLLPGAAAERWQCRLAPEPWADVRVGAVDDLDGVYASCQAAAFPFRWSTTLTPALAAAEAMATGLPLVATTVDCLAPLVEHGVNGALVPPNDPAGLGHALVRVLAEQESWEQMSKSARKTIESRWSWSAAAEATRDAYSLAIRRSR